MPDINNLMPTTPDLNRERLEQLKALMPDLFTNDGRLDPEELKRLVAPESVSDSEKFEFRWFGKAAAKRRAFTPTTGTLQYDAARSVNPGAADGNMIIEGENLEVLKCLLSAYRERIKCIYIDPPYNTGKDFVYSDNYTEGRQAYWEQTGATEEGVKVETNPETSGRFHSNWLNMLYPRLLAARQLLRDDGVLLVSIDDNEYQNLKHLLDEAFGADNFIATLVWEKGRKNDAKLFSVGHEYLVVYAKSKAHLKDVKTVWREEKPGAKEIWEKYLELKKQHGDNFAEIENGLTIWFQSLPQKHPSKKLSRYRRVDKFGPWRDRDISWPGGGGPRYDVLHERTKEPCKVPERGWGFATFEEMQRQIKLGLVVFRDDHTEPPFRKAHLKPVPEELDAELVDENYFEEEDEGFAVQVRGSYFYKQSQVAVKLVRDLLGAKIFQNPKDHEEIAKLLYYVTTADKEALFLDFFAGSGTTSQAVMELNREDGGNRKFILVQLPELTDSKSEAFKAGYKRISDITIERNKRVIARIEQEQAKAESGQQDIFAGERKPYRPGFKVYRMVKSHFPRVEFQPDPDKSAAENLAAFKRYISEKETQLYSLFNEPDIFDEVMLKNGFMLHYSRTRRAEFTANTVYHVSDGRKEALVCLDTLLKDETISRLKDERDRLFICLECAVDTTKKWNLKHLLGDKLVAF